MSKFFFMGFVVSIVISSVFPAYATIKGDIRKNLSMGQVLENALGQDPTPMRIKNAVADIIKGGGDAYQVVKIALNSGLDPEAVIAGGIEGPGRLTDIFRAALDAGYNENFISRAASYAGESTGDIESALAIAVANSGSAGSRQ